MKQFLYSHRLFFAILILAAVLRFALLGAVPTAITGDELIYPTTARAILLTGHDITGTWNPLTVFAFRYPPGELQAELPYYIHVIANSFLPFTLFSYRYPFALLSVGIVALMYLIAKKLFGIHGAIFTGILAAINPWFIVMGRTGYESTPATFFYLLGLYIVIAYPDKLLYALPVFILGFYSYIGTKILFIPFIVLSLILSYKLHKKLQKNAVIAICVLAVIFVGFFASQMATSGQSRLSDILLPTAPEFAQKVDSIRKISIPNPLLSVMVNKFTMFGEHLMDKTFRIFSVSYLFSQGDNFFLQARHSFFYPVESIFIILGLGALFTMNQGMFVILMAFILLGAIPHVIHRTESDFSGHLALMFPFIILVLGYGLSFVYTHASKAYRQSVILMFTLVYALSIGNFLLVYFYQLPLQGAGDFQMRTLSKYLSFAREKQQQVFVYSTQGADIFKKYLVYADRIQKDTIPSLAKPMKPDSPITFDGITFTSCDNSIDVASSSAVHIVSSLCGFPTKQTMTHTKLSRLSDGGTIFDIYNNDVCNRDILSTYPNNITLKDFAVESMSASDFCTTYVSK